VTEIGSKHGDGVAGVEFMAGPPHPSPPRNRGGSQTAFCPVSPACGGIKGGSWLAHPTPDTLPKICADCEDIGGLLCGFQRRSNHDQKGFRVGSGFHRRQSLRHLRPFGGSARCYPDLNHAAFPTPGCQLPLLERKSPRFAPVNPFVSGSGDSNSLNGGARFSRGSRRRIGFGYPSRTVESFPVGHVESAQQPRTFEIQGGMS